MQKLKLETPFLEKFLGTITVLKPSDKNLEIAAPSTFFSSFVDKFVFYK